MSECSLGHGGCLRLFSASKLLSQGVHWFKVDVSRCFLGQNWRLRCFMGQNGGVRVYGRSHFGSPGCSSVAIGCLTVFSGTKLMSQGVCWVTIKVSWSFLIQR